MMSELKVERKENMCGGEGHVLIKHILGEKELNGKWGLYAEPEFIMTMVRSIR